MTAGHDQARWLLAQQQRRSESFQQGAVALIGVDGVLLAILVSGDALASTSRYGAAWWATAVGAGLFVVSALCGIGAILPRSTSTVPAESTVKAWRTFRDDGGYNRDALSFADNLLAAKPKLTKEQRKLTRRGKARARIRTLLHLPRLGRQPLLAAEQLATVRGLWTLRAGAALIAGLACLVLVLIRGRSDRGRPTRYAGPPVRRLRRAGDLRRAISSWPDAGERVPT